MIIWGEIEFMQIMFVCKICLLLFLNQNDEFTSITQWASLTLLHLAKRIDKVLISIRIGMV